MDYIKLHDYQNPKTPIVVSCSEIAAIEVGPALKSTASLSESKGCIKFGSKITMKYSFPHLTNQRVTFLVTESVNHIYSLIETK